MARLPDPVPDLDEYGKSIYEKLKGARGEVRGMYRTLLHNPKLADHVGDLGAYFRFKGSLPGDLRELVILATARGTGVVYEWLMHLKPAKEAGLPDEVVEELLNRNPDTSEIKLLYRDAWRVANHVVAQEVIPENLQNSLIEQLGTSQVIELVAVCGFYRFIGCVAVGFDVELPPHVPPLPF